MVVVKHQEPELVKKKKKHHPETGMAVISDEIFSSLKTLLTTDISVIFKKSTIFSGFFIFYIPYLVDIDK